MNYKIKMITTFFILALFGMEAHAHKSVVVIPMGGDTVGDCKMKGYGVTCDSQNKAHLAVGGTVTCTGIADSFNGNASFSFVEDEIFVSSPFMDSVSVSGISLSKLQIGFGVDPTFPIPFMHVLFLAYTPLSGYTGPYNTEQALLNTLNGVLAEQYCGSGFQWLGGGDSTDMFTHPESSEIWKVTPVISNTDTTVTLHEVIFEVVTP